MSGVSKPLKFVAVQNWLKTQPENFFSSDGIKKTLEPVR